MNRRLKQFPIHVDLILGWLRECWPGAVAVSNHLPGDARIVEARIHDQRYVVLILESEAYPPVPEGAPVPMADAVDFRVRMVPGGHLLTTSAN